MLAESVQSNFLPMRRFGGPSPLAGLKFPTDVEFWTTDQAGEAMCTFHGVVRDSPAKPPLRFPSWDD